MYKNRVSKTKVETRYIGKLIDIAIKLSNINGILWKHKENSITKLDHISAAKCPNCAYPTPGATCREASQLAAPQDGIKSCTDMLCTPSTSRITPTGNHGNHGTEHVTSANNWIHLAGICDEGFNVVVKKNKKPSDLPSLEEHKSRPPATPSLNKELFGPPRHIREISIKIIVLF
jgi:hypothetical protein